MYMLYTLYLLSRGASLMMAHPVLVCKVDGAGRWALWGAFAISSFVTGK